MMPVWKIRKMLKKILKIYNKGTNYIWKGKEYEQIKEMIERGYLKPDVFIDVSSN